MTSRASRSILLFLWSFLWLCAGVRAQDTTAAHLPIREVTAFKDGHAFVLRSGEVAMGADGRIVLDELPQPILGTFWPAVGGAGCKLRHVTAGRHRIATERTALELRQLLAANIGAEIVVREVGDLRYRATIVDLPARPADEVAGTDGPSLPQPGDVVLLRTVETRRDTSAERIADAGTRLVKLQQIVDVTFVTEPRRRVAEEVLEPRLVLDVACEGARPATVPVQLGWIEHGFRWIPSYRVELDGKGKATLMLQATLVNDLADLEDTTLHLVVGVPSFVGKDLIDPIALQAAVADATRRMGASLTPNAFSNAMMTQLTYNAAPYSPPAADTDAGTEVPGHKEQDLFVFTVTGITLRKHDRMVVPILTATVDYADVYRLDVPLQPPQDAWAQMQAQPQDLARLLAAPKVRHLVRLTNTGAAPFTTAPALVTQGAQVLAQGTMTYTPPQRACDLALTTAVDVLVQKTDEETGRQRSTTFWDRPYTRVDLAGRLKLANGGRETVRVEVRRQVFGRLDEVGDGGSMRQLDTNTDDVIVDGGAEGRQRWSWFWSWWSLALNGAGEAKWTVTLEPGKEAEVGCKWHYFWQ